MTDVMETIRSMFDEAIDSASIAGLEGLAKHLNLLRMLVIANGMTHERGRKSKTVDLVAFTRDETKNTRSPFWRCRSKDGLAVNVFKHDDELKDNFHLFENAGYGETLLSILVGVSQNWTNHPVKVDIIEDGQFWKITAVAKRLPDDMPDIDDWSDVE